MLQVFSEALTQCLAEAQNQICAEATGRYVNRTSVTIQCYHVHFPLQRSSQLVLSLVFLQGTSKIEKVRILSGQDFEQLRAVALVRQSWRKL